MQCRVQGLSLRFPDAPERKVLDAIDLTVRAGESVLLLGPSGSGKSSLGYVLAGLIPRSIEAAVQGEVQVEGRVGILFQDPEAQFCMLTAEDEVAFGLENLRVPPAEMPPRIDSVLRRFGLLDWKSRNTMEMSGGMKQKLALACLLAMQPDLYILDEPTANLDPAATRDVLQAIRKLHQAEGKTVIIIEHKVEGVLDWVDRVVLLGPDGRLLDEGAPADVFCRRQAEIESFGIWQPTLWKWAVQLGAVPVSPAGSRQETGEPADSASGGHATGSGAVETADFPTTAEEFVDRLTPEKLPQLLRLLERETGSGGLTNQADLNSTSPIFQVRDAEFGYRPGEPIWGPLSFDILPGEWVAIVGPNGSGKSTLLAALMGLRRLSAGRIQLAGQPLDSYSTQELSKRLGFVFQNPEHQFITDTVWQEVAFGADVFDPAMQERVRAILDDLGLLHVANANPFSLSQGEKRRLSVATTLLTPHQALLLDEPTFGQDAYTARQLEEKLADLHRAGRTIVMVTHDLELVARKAQKVLVLANGKLAFAGTPVDLFGCRSRGSSGGWLPAAAIGGQALAGTGGSASQTVNDWLRQANLEPPVAFQVLAAMRRKAGVKHADFAAVESVR